MTRYLNVIFCDYLKNAKANHKTAGQKLAGLLSRAKSLPKPPFPACCFAHLSPTNDTVQFRKSKSSTLRFAISQSDGKGPTLNRIDSCRRHTRTRLACPNHPADAPELSWFAPSAFQQAFCTRFRPFGAKFQLYFSNLRPICI